MPKIDIAALRAQTGSGYPAPYDQPCRERTRKRLGDGAGLTDFGVNLLTLKPGVWSSQRHWHHNQDEFVYVLVGEVSLVTDGGEQVLHTGDCAAFPKGDGDGHHLINRTEADALVLEVGTRDEDVVDYPGIDLVLDTRKGGYAHKDGSLYPPRGR